MSRRHIVYIGACILCIVCVSLISAYVISGSSPMAVVQRVLNRATLPVADARQGDAVLPIVFDRQDHALSCEAADLKMVLAYRGIAVTEAQLLADIGFDTTPKTKNGDITIWGDPDVGFVGDVDGRMLRTGYGVNAKPVAAAAKKYRRAEAFERGTAAMVAEQIVDGNPVIVWGHLGSGKKYTWQTPGGKTITGILSEHPRVAYGFRGTADAPEVFFLMDPIYGKRAMPVKEFMQQWSVFGYSGVIVY